MGRSQSCTRPRLESFQNFNVGGGSSAPELYTIGPDRFEYGFID
jgi:hypothetical protein